MVASAQIPLSLISGDPEGFKRDLAAYCAALSAHRAGKAGVPAPIAHPLLDALVVATHRGDPLPDSFEVLPYEIVDDTPPPPSLQERKGALLGALQNAANEARNSILSPARAQLLNLNFAEAMGTPEEMRTLDQAQCVAAYVAFTSRTLEIGHNAAHAAVEIEELTDANVDAWKVPEL